MPSHMALHVSFLLVFVSFLRYTETMSCALAFWTQTSDLRSCLPVIEFFEDDAHFWSGADEEGAVPVCRCSSDEVMLFDAWFI